MIFEGPYITDEHYPSDESIVDAKREVIKTTSPARVFSCTDIDKFLNNVVTELDYNGSSPSRLFLCIVGDVRFLTKFSIYRMNEPERYGQITSGNLPEIDAEIAILTKLRDNVIYKGYTPCIVEILYSKTCTVSKLAPSDRICSNYAKNPGDGNLDDRLRSFLCDAKWLVESGLAHDKCAFIILDRCDISFESFLERSHDSPIEIAVFLSLLFEIIHAMYAITKVYPGFRHGDLHSHNVQIKFNDWVRFDMTRPEFRLFVIDGKNFYIPYFGMTPKIIDFGFSSLPEEGITSSATDNKLLMNYRSKNDILFFLHNIYYTSIVAKLAYLRDILAILEPNFTYANYNTEYIRKIEHKIPTYKQMLSNSLFAGYARDTPPVGKIISRHEI